MSTSDEQEKLNAQKKEGVDIDNKVNENLQNHSKMLEEILQKYSGQNQLLQENAASQSSITAQLKEQLKNAGENKEEVRETLNLSKQAATAIKNSIGPHSTINEIEKQRTQNFKVQEQIKQTILKLGVNEIGFEKELEESLKRRIEFNNKTISLEKAAKDLQQQQLNALDEYNLAKKVGDEAAIVTAKHKLDGLGKTQQELRKEIQLHNKNEQAASSIETSQVKQAQALLDTNKNLEDANEELRTQLEIRENINKATGLTGMLLKGINAALGGALGNVSEILKESDKQIEALIKQRSYYDENGKLVVGTVSAFKGLSVVMKEVGKSILDNMADPLVIIGALLDFSAQTTKFSKELGVSKDKANQLKKEFNVLSGEINKGFDSNVLNSERLINSISGINEELGGMAFSFQSKELSQMAAEATIFQETMGGTAEESNNLMGSALTTGTTFRRMQKDIVAVTNEIEKQTGLQFDATKLMKEASLVTGQMRSQLGGSVTEISKVLAVAKSFGMEMSQIKNIAGGLLDFESSINAELEAELLTGKQLNLEQARLYALTGDYEGLTREINKNVGDFNDFSKMNVLQQESMAKALGMSADSMADMLFKEGNLKELKAKALKDNDTTTLKMLEQRDIQQQMADIVFQLKQNFINAIGGAEGLEATMKAIGTAVGKITNFLSSDFGQVVIKAVVLGKILGSFIPIFKTLKFLSGALKLNTLAINIAEKMGLITKNQAVRAKGRENLLQTQGVAKEQLSNFHKNAGLGTLLSKNAANTVGLGQKTTENTLEAQGNTLKNTGLLTRIREVAINAANIVKRVTLNSLKTIGNVLGITSLSTTVAEGAAETVITGAKVTQNKSMGGLITKGLVYLGTLVAQAAAAIAGASALTLGIGLAGILAATAVGVAYLYSVSKPKKTGDFMSKGQNIGESATPGGLGGNEGLISVGGKTRTFDTNVDEVNISPNAVTGITPVQTQMKTSPTTINQQQDNTAVIAAIKALGEKPGMMQQSTDTLPPPTDLFTNSTKIGKGMYQEQNESQVLFT